MIKAVCPKMVQDLRTIRNKERYYSSFKELVLKKSIAFLTHDHSWLEGSPDVKQKFCLLILATTCSKIVVSNTDLCWINDYFSIICELDLGEVFCSYCDREQHRKCIIAPQLPDKIKSHSSKDLCRY